MRTYCAYHFTVSPIEKIEIASAWLSTFAFESFVQDDNGITAYIPQDQTPDNLLEDCLIIPFEGVKISADVKTIGGQNWNAVWEAQFHPITVGDWTLRASFHAAATTPYEIIIDPQMSFGTGHHATTQLMFEQLVELNCNDASVFDVGTGTGVLAITAKKMGASSVLGVDIEDWCVENAKENASKNGILDISFSTDAIDLLPSNFDVILANINRNVLLEHLPKYATLLHKNGVLLLSGFHEDDVAVLTDLAQSNGFRLEGKTEKEGWICLKFIL